MINLFHINKPIIDTSKFSNLLHDKNIEELEQTLCNYVGAKYGCAMNSASSIIFLAMLRHSSRYSFNVIKIPSLIPPVVLNSIINAERKYEFVDDVNWVGNDYVLFKDHNIKIIDSAQKLRKNQFLNEEPNTLMFFSFYPTKPLGGSDGGLIVSNNYDMIKWFKEASLNGMEYSENNWDRKIKFPGWKMYMNSIQAEIILQNFKKYEYKLDAISDIRKIYNKHFGLDNTSDHLYRLNVSNRDELINIMKDNGVMCGIHYHATHLNPIYRNYDVLRGDGSLKISEKVSKTTISIPMHEQLSGHDLKKIMDLIDKYSKPLRRFDI